MTKTEEIMNLVYQLECAVKNNNCDFSNAEDDERHTDARESLKSAIEELVADAEKMASEIQEVSKFLKNVMTKYEHKIVEEFADGYYSCALATLNRMYELNKMADAATKETP